MELKTHDGLLHETICTRPERQVIADTAFFINCINGAETDSHQRFINLLLAKTDICKPSIGSIGLLTLDEVEYLRLLIDKYYEENKRQLARLCAQLTNYCEKSNFNSSSSAGQLEYKQGVASGITRDIKRYIDDQEILMRKKSAEKQLSIDATIAQTKFPDHVPEEWDD